MSNWNSPNAARPEEHRKISWLDSTGQEIHGTFHDGHWFHGPELTTYIYYRPVFWQYAEEE